MSTRRLRMLLLVAASALPAAGVLVPSVAGRAAAPEAAPAVAGLDHIPIGVSDLEQAAEQYRRLGFSLKPGRPHPNGIRNQHVKFPDGTELELITAPEARDPLTAAYRRHLASGDGPAFLALFAPGPGRAPAKPEAPLDYLFFGRRNASPTDRPEHFAHANTAESFARVWLAADDISRERALFERLGATISRRDVYVPDRVMADVARFRDGEAILLPAAYQRVPGRRILGATLRVRSAGTARALLSSRGIGVDADAGAGGRSVFVAPSRAHGLWIEFREND